MNWLRLLALAFLLVVPVLLQAQKVNLLTIDQMEQRFSKGKDTVYIVNFWATWCSPCVAELPYFEKLQKMYKEQPLKVMLVSLDLKSKLESAVEPFVRKAKFQNEVFLLNEGKPQEYIDHISKDWTGAIPATLFVNRNKNSYNFYEKEFSFDDLNDTYQSLK